MHSKAIISSHPSPLVSGAANFVIIVIIVCILWALSRDNTPTPMRNTYSYMRILKLGSRWSLWRERWFTGRIIQGDLAIDNETRDKCGNGGAEFWVRSESVWAPGGGKWLAPNRNDIIRRGVVSTSGESLSPSRHFQWFCNSGRSIPQCGSRVWKTKLLFEKVPNCSSCYWSKWPDHAPFIDDEEGPLKRARYHFFPVPFRKGTTTRCFIHEVYARANAR